ncbi:MAG: DPP IV N-terminal domain-containing protein [Bacteroidaceae bacterium]
MKLKTKALFLFAAATLCPAMQLFPQGTVEDYKRAFAAAQTYSNDKILGNASNIQWNGDEHRFWYTTNTADGLSYVVVDADNKTRASYKTMEEVRTALNIPAPEEERRRGPRRPQKHWMVTDPENEGGPVKSPDGKMEAYVKNYNLYVRNLETKEERALTNDGGLGFYYSCYISWSPDGKKLTANKLRRAEKHYVSFVESSPADQLQPKLHTMEYCKPGDEVDYHEPRIVNLETGEVIAPSTELFSHQYSLSTPYWSQDSKAVYFEYNERGHKVYRLLELSAETGKVRPVVEETSDKFVNYSRLYRQFINGGKELLWTSERDNHNHIYLYDVATGKVKRQITKGEWYVRQILRVDEENGVIYFTANGMRSDEDPYLLYYYRIGLDGKNLVCLTPEEGNHSARFSSDWKYLVDTYSKADVPPVTELRDAETGKLVMSLEKADISKLLAAGWKAPEVFHAPGRDGKTEMWGIIQRPSNFDPNKKYPIIEYIYSGPGDAYVPKSFIPYNWTTTALAEIGFIVVQLDAMGTSYRSKEFEEVCYKNLKDAGLPDRMEWIKAAAKKYPYMDIDRVGIYGCSAGGQESTAAVLQYPDFYKAAYSACGCHDNRMDKIWWNEQWMGYPIDSSYVACSNVEMAHKLRVPLMLVVGEMDDNVDPASTMQVVNALIKANKDFDLLVIPGARHTMGEAYGEHKRYDFFVENLMGKFPPKWSEFSKDAK